MNKKLHPFKNLRDDFPASIVVFLVAMPLCLGIALASGAPLYSGLISGVIGGIVVGAFSGSALGVSGPAAGLAVIILEAISDLGSFEILLVAVVIAGVIQLIMGFLRAGVIAYFFPASVIHGMLAGIGIVIAVKQIPHLFGYDKDPEGDMELFQADGQNTFSELYNMLNYVAPGVLIVSALSILLLILWETKLFKGMKFTRFLPGPLIVVVVGIVCVTLFQSNEFLVIQGGHLVNIPLAGSLEEFAGNLTFPDFTSALKNPNVYITAIFIAIIASLETLLCVEAADKLDPLKRRTSTNRELKAQGIGNILAGLIGGLPVTQVIVRSSANIQSGGKTKASAILHGILLLLSILFIPFVLNWIPMGTLAAILLVVGYKLAKPALFRDMYKQGWEQFIPFLATIIGILATDLLIGIGIGLAVAIFVILRNNFRVAFTVHREQGKIHIELAHEVSFLNKASIREMLSKIEDDSEVVIDGRNTQFLHHDVSEILQDFIISAEMRNLNITVLGLDTLKIS